MLDKEIYGIIAALGLLLAIFFVFFYMLNLISSNIKLKRKFNNAPDMQDYIKSQSMKGLLMFLLLVFLCALLLLVKKLFL
jgi:hypothetical protein